MYSANAPMVPRHTMPVRRFFFSVELAFDWALKLCYPWHLLDADHYDLNASHAWDIARQLGDWEMLRLHDCKKRDRGSLVWNAAVGPRLLETGRWCLTEVWSFEMFWDFSCCLYLFVVEPNHPTSGLSMEGIVSRNSSRCFKLLHFMLSFEQHFDRCAISALKNSKHANSSDTLMTRSTLTLLGGFMRIPGLNMHPKREPKWPKLSAELMVSNGRAACDSVRTWEQLRQIGCFW